MLDEVVIEELDIVIVFNDVSEDNQQGGIDGILNWCTIIFLKMQQYQIIKAVIAEILIGGHEELIAETDLGRHLSDHRTAHKLVQNETYRILKIIVLKKGLLKNTQGMGYRKS